MELQNVIDSTITGTGADRVGDRIDLGKWTIDLHDTLHVAKSVHGVHLDGRGRATRIRWLGPDDVPVFCFTDGNGCQLSNLSVELVNRASILVQMSDSGDGPIRSSSNVLRNIYVPDASERLGTFWRIGGGKDVKNDFMRGYDLDVSGCEVGVVVEGRNSVNHELYGCQFKGRTGGKVGIRTIDGGSVRMFGGSLNQFKESAFDIDTRNGVALVASGVYLEKCRRLLTAPAPIRPAVTTHVAILDGLRWGSAAADLPADGEIIHYSGGTLIVRGCWFWTSTPNETEYRFRYSTTQTHGDFVFEDCRVRAKNEDGHWPGEPPNSVRGSLLHAGPPNQPVPMPPT